MPDITFRAATQDDADDIKALIHLVRINPMNLDWRRFLIASHADRGPVACAQIKPHTDGTQEFASLAVHPDFRGHGLARQIVERLLADAPRPLYLTCISNLEPLYKKFGFRALAKEELTPYFRRVQAFAGTMLHLFANGESLLVMRLDA